HTQNLPYTHTHTLTTNTLLLPGLFLEAPIIVLISTPTYPHTYAQTYMHTRTRAHTHTHAQTYKHTRLGTYMFININTHTHLLGFLRTCIRDIFQNSSSLPSG